MSGRAEPKTLRLDLSQRDVAILAAALRQYEPYWSPDDVDAAEKLSELVRDIKALLDRLRAVEPARLPGRLGTFSRAEPMLRLVPSISSGDLEVPT
jgi:hypothetical protein